MRTQVLYWKKPDHPAFILMLPFITAELFRHSPINCAVIIVLWATAFVYDLYEHSSEGG